MSVTVTPLQISSITVTPLRVAVAPGPSDHGALAGLGDDDHLQYFNEARADARYALLSHAHAIAGVTGLQSALDGKAPEAHTHAVTDLEPYRPVADYAFDIPLVDPTGVVDPEIEPGEPIFGFCGNSGVFNNAAPGSGLNPYRDHAAFLGYNLKDGGVQNDPALPACGLAWESKYTQTGGTILAHEFYLRCLKADGTEYRPFGGYIPYDGEGINFAFACDDVYFNRDDNTQGVKFSFGSGNLFVYAGNKFVFLQNNTAVATQRNAANTADLKLPWIDDTDTLRLEQKLLVTPAAGQAGIPAFGFSIQGTPVNGELGMSISYAAATNATVEVLRTWGNSNWDVKTSLYNSHASGMAACEVMSGGGPAVTRYSKPGVQDWAVGKNASHNFEIAAAFGPGTNTALTIDKTTRQAAFNAPPKLPSYTVAALPNAATAGAGAKAYVSDASGGPTIACSDGTNWRVVAALGATVS